MSIQARVLCQRACSGHRIEAQNNEQRQLVYPLSASTKTRGAPNEWALRQTRYDSRHRDLVHETERLWTSRFDESLSLADVAAHVGSSVYHLCRVFRRITGTIHRYRQQLRLRATLEAVRDPRVSLPDIAARFGFPSHSHFTHAFRREFAVVPSALRRGARTCR